MEFFCSVFSSIRMEYENLKSIPYNTFMYNDEKWSNKHTVFTPQDF